MFKGFFVLLFISQTDIENIYKYIFYDSGQKEATSCSSNRFEPPSFLYGRLKQIFTSSTTFYSPATPALILIKRS